MKLKIDFDISADELKSEWPSFFTIGSCFADSQAQRMKKLGMDVQSNPFGIVYNPISIEKILERISNTRLYTEVDFVQKATYFSWEHHGDFKYPSINDAITHSNLILKESNESLAQANVVIVTLGTSLVYSYNSSVVANCHKQPNKEFEHNQLSFEQTKKSIQGILDQISNCNTEAKVIFTVSPIRHLRSGVATNSRSKAVLISAIHEVLHGNKQHNYFPSYEIFIDELRDYRFAKSDMTHPTEQAEEYIWQRFCETYLSDKTQSILQDVKKYTQLAAHRPIHAPELHQKQVAEKLKTLQTNYPFLQLK